MKKTKTFFIVSGALVAGLVTLHTIDTINNKPQEIIKTPTTSYGAFLAAQHALHTNNFDKANEFLYNMDENAQQYKIVDEIRVLTDFLNGVIPNNANALSEDKALISTIIRDAYWVQNNDWENIYNKHKDLRILAPLRIWSGVATNRTTDTLKFIDSLETHPSWRAFLRGQVYAEQGKTKQAAKAFAEVKPEFLNINDYVYLMAFYKHNKLETQANALKSAFTAQPGSMFMNKYTNIPDWKEFSGYKNQLAFNLLQTVAHNNAITHSDLHLLLLSFAKNIAPTNPILIDAVNYHAGIYMVKKNGNVEKYFSQINTSSPYYPFVQLRLADATHDERVLRAVVDEYPLFMPATRKLVGWNVQNGSKKSALKIIEKSLDNPDISFNAKSYLYKMLADVHFIFDDTKAAQKALDKASALLSKPDLDIASIQSKIWAKNNQNLDKAYSLGLQLIKIAPGDNCAWDTLGYVIWKREGVDAALEILQKVGEVANSCSALFEHIGDMYAEIGDEKQAKDAYIRAITLSDDGFVAKPLVEKKLKRLK